MTKSVFRLISYYGHSIYLQIVNLVITNVFPLKKVFLLVKLILKTISTNNYSDYISHIEGSKLFFIHYYCHIIFW